jgi:hypothetical protein
MPWIVLLATVTTAEIRAAMLTSMTIAGLPTSLWTIDGLWQNLVEWVALIVRGLTEVLRSIALNAFLDTATGQGLTDLARNTYGTERRLATYATGTATYLNTTGGLVEFDIDGVSFELKTNTEITYRNSQAISVANGATVTFGVVCEYLGTQGNAAAGAGTLGTIALVTAIPGFQFIQNSAIVGQDEQDDASLRYLARRQAAVASTSHRSKYEWIAFNTNTDGTLSAANDGKTRTNVARALVSFDDAQGRVYVTLAAPNGPMDAGEFTTTQNAIIQRALNNPGIPIITNVTAVPIVITGAIELENGSSTSGVATAVYQYVNDWFASPSNLIGGGNGFLAVDELKLLIGRANPAIRKVTLTSPLADVAISSVQMATLSSITLSVTVQ